MRKEKVTPKGTPVSTNPRNNGMAEHEQKGVTMPNIAAMTFPVKVLLPSNALRVRSGVKKLLMIPTKKIIKVSNNNTLGNSKIKNHKVN